jgi:superfamily II DNA or RNA helicase
MVRLGFEAGTVRLEGVAEDADHPAPCVWDARTRCHRAPAVAYAEIVRWLHERDVDYDDGARAYDELPAGARALMEPRSYQREAIAAWRRAKGRGVVVLPTGAGKTHVAMLAIDLRRRSTLVVAPTLDLVRQWYDILRRTFDQPVGVVGGGDHQVESLTVTTYDSAYIHMEHLGARFGLVVFDECHHLPSAAYAFAARACLAPFRLGLSATPERADGRESELDELIGPEVYRREIVELSGDYLAEYETRRIQVHLSREERAEHDEERRTYLAFLRGQGIHMGNPGGWNEFIMRSAMSDTGRRAMQAYRRQRDLAFAAPAKLQVLDHLMHQHRSDRMLVFTQDNATAYLVSRRFLVPAITHQTKVTERSEILEGLARGSYRAVVTSKVLNEGVDVPEANVAIVISGSGSVREHVQRLGRILRPREDKRAVLYELVTADTAEGWTSERRRDHVAYR